MPPPVQPMLASSGSLSETGDDWAFEPKLDGWRAMVYISHDALMVRTRSGRDVTANIPEIRSICEFGGGRELLLDGELVADQGLPNSFYRLGPRMASRSPAAKAFQTPVTFVAFDLLWLDGDCKGAPYVERRAALEALGFSGTAWCTAPSFPAAGAELFTACASLGLEGVVAKRLSSPYRSGVRSRNWVKAKTESWKAVHGPMRHER